MPKLWTATVETHRQQVREAIVDATNDLAAEHGLLALTMSQIAEAAGIGRATLYKYFADVEEVIAAWHHRQVAVHLGQLRALREQRGTPTSRLRAVLEAYAEIARQREHGAELASALHRDRHVDHAEQELRDLLAGLIQEAAVEGTARSDVPPAELAAYCVHALSAAAGAGSARAVDRLVQVVWAGLASSAAAAPSRSAAG